MTRSSPSLLLNDPTLGLHTRCIRLLTRQVCSEEKDHRGRVDGLRHCCEMLKETFGDLANVIPARDRPRLVTWSGTYWGTGKSERLRMTCDRGGAGQRELVAGRGPQSSWISWDYEKELSSARFCPQPRGIAGEYECDNDMGHATDINT